MDSVSSSDGYDNDGEQRNQSPVPVPVPENSNGTDHSVRHEAGAGAEAGVRGRGSSNFIGKHRLAAAITQLQLQTQFIQEELDQLETLGESSLVCKELISSVESHADALLPTTKGVGDHSGWDRWFQGTHSSKHRKRWI